MTVLITGQKDGTISGELTQAVYSNLWEVLAFNFETLSPVDPSTGLPSGKRQHKPLKLVLRIGSNTPRLFGAMIANEILTQVDLRIYRPSTKAPGRENYLEIKLTNATIADIVAWQPNRLDSANDGYSPSVEIAFTYQKIEFTSPTGNTTATDDWSSP